MPTGPTRFTHAEALQAIQARIQGVFDDPQLMRYGPLSTDCLGDILCIVARATVPTVTPSRYDREWK